MTGASHTANSSRRDGAASKAHSGSSSSRGKGQHRKRRTSSNQGPVRNLTREQREIVFQPLDHATYIVFDIETTGGNPERNGITEICALKIHQGKIIDRFYSLVNPCISIPPIVRRMTGITNNMVKDAPLIEEVYPGFAEFIGGHILVSHNTIGDLIFLRHFARQTIGRDLENFFLCTHLLVEKLVHEAPEKSLKGLSKHFNLAGKEFHRAEADAIQTWELFKILQRKLKDHAVSRVEQAIRIQGDLDSSLRLGWAIDRDKIEAMPTGTGVFYLYDHERHLVFLSSALSVSREITKLQRHDLIPRQILKLALRSYDLEAVRCSSSFAAMLTECDEREKHKLQADPALFHQRQVQVIGIYQDRDDGLRVMVGPMESGLRHAFGPVKDRKRAVDFLDELAEVMGEKITRTGMLLSEENESLLVHYLSGTLGDFQRKIEKKLWGLRLMFWKRADAELVQRNLLMAASLINFRSDDILSWKNMGHLHGLIVVPDETPGSWQAHTIVGGLPRAVHLIRGEWDDRGKPGGLTQRLRKTLENEVKERAPHRKLSVADIGRMNAVQWWLQFGRSRDHGHFVDFSELQVASQDKKSLDVRSQGTDEQV